MAERKSFTGKLGAVVLFILIIWAVGHFTDISRLSAHHWAQIIGVSILTLIAGLIFDRATDRKAEDRPARLKSIGYDALTLHHNLMLRGNFRSEESAVAQYGPDVDSLFIRINKEGFETPKSREGLTAADKLYVWESYLQVIGKLLSDRQFEEAKERASTITKGFKG